MSRTRNQTSTVKPVRSPKTNGESKGSDRHDAALHARLVKENARLKRESDLLRTVIDKLPDFIYAKDRASRFLFNNLAHTQVLGAAEPDEVAGKTDLDIFPTEQAKQYFADEQALMKSNQSLEREETVVDPKTGQTRWLQTTKIPLHDEQGQVSGLVGISRDFTHRKQMEESLFHAHRQLQVLLDNIPDRIYFKDTQCRFVQCNLAVARRLNVQRPEQVIGKTDFDFYPQEKAQEFHQDEEKLLKTGRPLIHKIEQLVKPDGEISWAAVTKIPLRDPQGKIIGLVGISRNITEQKQAEEALRQSRDELEKRIAERTAELSEKNAALEKQIAERERAEEALVTAQRLLQALLDHVPDRIYFKDAQSRFIKLSRTLATRRGLTDPEQAIGKTDFDFFPPEKAAEFFADEQRIIRTGQPLINKIEKQTAPDGEVSWASVTKVPLRDEAGKVVGIAGINRDITNQKQVEDALAKERLLLRTLIDNLPDSIYAKDTAGRKTLANPADLKNLRCKTEAEAVGKNDFDLFPKETAEKFWADDQKVLQGEPVLKREEFYLDERGRKRWLLTSKLPLRSASGKIVGLVGIGSDITELKRAQETLRRSEERLREVMRRTRCILNSGRVEAPEGWREHALNPVSPFRWDFPVQNVEAAQEVFPLDVPPEGCYQHVWSLSRHPEDFTQMNRNSGNAFLHDEPFYRNEFRCTDRHGVEHWMQQFVTVQKLGENRWQLFGITTDITELKQTEGALRVSEDKLRQFTLQLERSNRELQDFAYVASHDLQEPLRKIVVFGERLKEKAAGKLEPETQDYLERMQKAAGRMQNLINDLLTFSRVTSKAQPFTTVDLAVTAREVVDDLEGRIEMTQGRVELGELPVIDAEPLQMRQLLQNLVGNALKFRRPETPPVVKIQAKIFSGVPPQTAPDAPAQKLCRLTVSDNGIGFEEKYLDRIFNVFQRLHSRNEYEGTGMGLAIARKIALYHGGAITAQSTVGQGATFIVTLPVAHPKPQTNGH